MSFGQARPDPSAPKPPINTNQSNGNGIYAPPGVQGARILFTNTFDDPKEVSKSQEGTKESTAATGAAATVGTSTNSAAPLNKINQIPFVLGSSFMTPSGWGSSGTFVFGGIGGTPNQVYGNTQRQRADLLAQVGFGVGDASKIASFVGIVNINDVSAVDNLSYSLMASRKLGKLSSISVGALHLFADPAKTDAGESYYVAYSQAIRKTKFSYTIGVGTGRFYDNSPADKYRGKAEHGTGVFANISYNLLKNVALSTEWTGTNLAFSSTVMLKQNWPALSFGVADVTRLTGDHPAFYAAIGKAFSFGKGSK